MYSPYEADVYAQVTVNGRAVEADVDAKGCARPSRVLGSTVEAHLEFRRRKSQLSVSKGGMLRDVRTLLPFWEALRDLKISAISSRDGSAILGLSDEDED